MQPISANITVDASGLACPMPLLKAKQALNKVAAGELVCVLATDATSTQDISNFVSLTRHEMVSHEEVDGVYTFLIRKGC